MNAYFQIISKQGKAFVRVYPANNGGEAIRREELVEYLQLKNIMYDPKDMMAAFTATEIIDIPTAYSYEYADSEFVKVTVSPDNMVCTVRVIPPFAGGKEMDKRGFLSELTSRGIVNGIDEAVIDSFLKERQYCTDLVVAKGTAPIQGSDAVIEYFFNTNPKIKPTLKEDGTVDFFNLNTIIHVKKGDLLAKLTPAVPGKPGKNIKGENIRPRDVRPAILKYGRNITMTDDKTELYSDVNGHVSFVEGKVFVSNVLEVENVDNSVGNIVYDGSVRVNGNVCENFKVIAKGSIEVRGVVEGAYLEATENIVVVRGMKGMHKGVLKAGKNIVCNFIENSSVTAEGNIDTESIMHSTVVSGGDVRVNGKKGFITGGRVCASNLISVKNLGSNMGADTTVEVGVDASVKMKAQELQKEITEINKSLAQITPVLDSVKQKLASGVKLMQNQIQQVQLLAVQSKELTARREVCIAEIEKCQEILDSETQGQVIVTGDVSPGTKIVIGDASMMVKTAMKYCRFVKQDGDVKMAAIY
ncbi:MAG: FapA family protein [Lachnospiraceae bacterium]|nr:FapA family protein [Lachnospiraceae bacterium]